MKKQKTMRYRSIIFFYILFFLTLGLQALNPGNVKTRPAPSRDEIGKHVQQWMQLGKIPGLTLVIVSADNPVYIKGYGYADLETQSPVTPDTLFQLASCSKAFTALALLELEKKGLINLDSNVSDHFSWFYLTHKKQEYKITLKQLLHHTSGLPREALSLIPRGNEDDALEQTVKNVNGIELKHIPGEHFQYNTVNYAIIGAVIEKVTGKPFEVYMKDYLFTPLGLSNTFVGIDKEMPLMATGYKRAFFPTPGIYPPAFPGKQSFRLYRIQR